MEKVWKRKLYKERNELTKEQKKKKVAKRGYVSDLMISSVLTKRDKRCAVKVTRGGRKN